MTVAGFGFDVRRWDGSPDPSYTVEYSTNSGTSFTTTNITINNAFLDNSSAWKTLTFTLPSPAVVTTGQFKVKVTRTSGERIMIDNFQWTTGTAAPDTTDPDIASLTPEDGATNVPAALTTTLEIQFDETVVKGTAGDITVKLASNDSTVMTIPVTDAAVVVAGDTATITLPASLAANTAYYINMPDGAFKDAANNTYNGITDTTTWNFTTAAVDVAAPVIITRVPADNSNNGSPLANLIATYDESVIAVGGDIVIKTFSGDSVVETIPVLSGQVQVSGSTVTINPTDNLAYNTAYYVEISAGAFKDAANNLTTAVTGNAAWNFTTRPAPAIVISQYYEGVASQNRYIELKNSTGSEITMDGYYLTVWSDSSPSDNEGWKSGTNTTTRVTDLSGLVIPANGNFLIVEGGATTPPTLPTYALNLIDLEVGGALGATDFNGDDSVVLYSTGSSSISPTFAQSEVVDAFSLIANDAEDASFYRVNDTAPGFDFDTGSSFLDYPSVWATDKSLADVNSAVLGDAWYLNGTNTPSLLTLSISPGTILESDGTGAALATVTRDGPTTEALTVDIKVSSASIAASADATVEIPAGQPSATFPIDAIDDIWQDGDQVVTVTVSVDSILTGEFYTPASDTIVVEDDAGEPAFPVVINEVDADQVFIDPVNDASEFVELHNKSNAPVSLDGMVLVFHDGNDDASYYAVDLTAHTIPANGYFVVGSVLDADIGVPANTLQNGPDAVALYVGDAEDFVENTPANAAPGLLVDAVVYDTSDADDTGLLAALTPGKPQVNEGATPASETVSIARVPDGGAAFDTTLYVAQAPTPGASNVASSGDDFAAWIGSFDFIGFTSPDLTATGDPDKDGIANALENMLGTSPEVFSQGLTAVSASGGDLIFRHTLSATPATDLTDSYEWSTNLVDWNASGVAVGATTVTFGTPAVITAGTANTPDLVEVTAAVVGTHPTKVFARYKVVQD